MKCCAECKHCCCTDNLFIKTCRINGIMTARSEYQETNCKDFESKEG